MVIPPSRLRTAGRWLLDLAFPRECAGCSTPLVPAEPDEFCAGCLATLPWMRPPVCVVCGEAFLVPSEADAERFEARTCVRCRDHRPAFAMARAAFAYEGPIRHAIHAVKFRGRRAAGAALGRLLVDGLARTGELPGDADVIVPVPLHPSRLHERGYNQAALVAAALASALGRPMEQDLLRRERATPPQVGLDRALRVENLKSAFGVPDPARVEGRVVLVVDDVLTTGATASACAVALRRGGAPKVLVAAVARG
ncbi:MAG: double zinc ribbon domain-containing protein [Candidatus Coatesbacteria bacterium]